MHYSNPLSRDGVTTEYEDSKYGIAIPQINNFISMCFDSPDNKNVFKSKPSERTAEYIIRNMLISKGGFISEDGTSKETERFIFEFKPYIEQDIEYEFLLKPVYYDRENGHRKLLLIMSNNSEIDPTEKQITHVGFNKDSSREYLTYYYNDCQTTISFCMVSVVEVMNDTMIIEIFNVFLNRNIKIFTDYEYFI